MLSNPIAWLTLLWTSQPQYGNCSAEPTFNRLDSIRNFLGGLQHTICQTTWIKSTVNADFCSLENASIPIWLTKYYSHSIYSSMQQFSQTSHISNSHVRPADLGQWATGLYYCFFSSRSQFQSYFLQYNHWERNFWYFFLPHNMQTTLLRLVVVLEWVQVQVECRIRLISVTCTWAERGLG